MCRFLTSAGHATLLLCFWSKWNNTARFSINVSKRHSAPRSQTAEFPFGTALKRWIISSYFPAARPYLLSFITFISVTAGSEELRLLLTTQHFCQPDGNTRGSAGQSLLQGYPGSSLHAAFLSHQTSPKLEAANGRTLARQKLQRTRSFLICIRLVFGLTHQSFDPHHLFPDDCIRGRAGKEYFCLTLMESLRLFQSELKLPVLQQHPSCTERPHCFSPFCFPPVPLSKTFTKCHHT